MGGKLLNLRKTAGEREDESNANHKTDVLHTMPPWKSGSSISPDGLRVPPWI
jgi:hypothetical protein